MESPLKIMFKSFKMKKIYVFLNSGSEGFKIGMKWVEVRETLLEPVYNRCVFYTAFLHSSV
jgi:hypothetical protein